MQTSKWNLGKMKGIVRELIPLFLMDKQPMVLKLDSLSHKA